MSDAPLFRRLTHTVAVNADRHLSDLARIDYRGSNLAESCELARPLLDHRPAQPAHSGCSRHPSAPRLRPSVLLAGGP
ncbi:hypothetical protein Acsp04_21710 [Actinomadura sp. NBRC 104425]|uniref:hypothetical protein n=1 Tax=Actinomadura sp. NBRC 104425 TaxID=3032204 RepID=UPI0024A30F2C|nr:hypothetical protein [Actinomadura sp. NBRC 104425]GLZ11936.1 hypothetical protein Acsp04_21710 [Actinomadura sp. NBRC 104425]